MVQINFAQKTVNVKIVFYGPGMSGKTTNLEVVHQRAPDTNRGELTSISTDGDRTLFFDYMPLELGTVAGMRTSFQLYTVPGQVYYNSTRKLVLQGVDGVIFIADSGASMLEQNIESLRNLEENLNEYGKSLASLPHVIQYNKRDLPDAMPVEELNRLLNTNNAPYFEAIANTGQGVFPTLKALAASVLKNIMQETSGGGSGFGSKMPAGAAPAAAVPAAPSPTMPAAGGVQAAGAPAAPSPSFGQPQPAQQAPAMTTAPTAQAAPAGQLMQPTRTRPAGQRPKARPQKAGSAASRARQQAAPKEVAPPKKKGSSVGLFIGVAAVIGAAAAWVVLTVL